MRDRKRTFEKEQFNSNLNPLITMEYGELFFEIGKHLTNDVAEGVILLMLSNNNDKSTWNIKLNHNSEISPVKSLYWITGGDRIWGTTRNTISGWGICGDIFVDEYGDDIIDIIKKSSTLGDVRDGINNRLIVLQVDYKEYYKYCK